MYLLKYLYSGTSLSHMNITQYKDKDRCNFYILKKILVLLRDQKVQLKKSNLEDFTDPLRLFSIIIFISMIIEGMEK